MNFCIPVSFIFSLSAGITETGDPVSIVDQFSVLFVFTVVVNYLFLSTSLLLSFYFTFHILRLYLFSDQQALAMCPFFTQLLHVCSSAGHFFVGFQFGALNNIQGLLMLKLFLCLVANLSIL